MEHDLTVVFITAANAAEAKRLADALLTARLAACVNIVPAVSSHYWWQGKIESADEVLLIIKSRAAFLDAIIKCVKELHSYDTPEIIALPVTGGSADYLEWVKKETECQP